MKRYELTYLINPELTQEQINSLEEIVKSHIQTKNGILAIAPKKPIKANLGYSIKKKKTAVLSVLNFSLEPAEIEKLKEKLSREKEILRFMLVNKKLIKPEKKSKKRIYPLIKKAKPISISQKSSVVKTKPLIKKEKKVELEEIGKKLEEILKL